MSRSPKYSPAVSSAERRRQEERARQERERQRQLRIQQREREALKKAREQARKRLRQVTASADALEAGSAERNEITGTLAKLSGAVSAAADMAAVSAALKQIDQMEHRVSAALAAADLRRRSLASDQLAALRGTLTRIDPQTRQRFDPAGAAETEQLLSELADLVAHGDTATFAARIDAAAAAATQHTRQVSEGAAQRAELRREVSARRDELAGRVAELRADASAAGIQLEDLTTASQVIDLISGQLATDQLEEAAGIESQLARRLDQTEHDLDVAIDRVTARRQLLGAIIEALPTLGLAADQDSLTETPDGSIGVQAFRRNGEAVAIVVQEDPGGEHRISYMAEVPSGHDLEANVLSARACDTVADLATALNESASTAGFDIGKVTWDDHGDRPPPGHAVLLPSQLPKARRVGEQ